MVGWWCLTARVKGRGVFVHSQLFVNLLFIKGYLLLIARSSSFNARYMVFAQLVSWIFAFRCLSIALRHSLL